MSYVCALYACRAQRALPHTHTNTGHRLQASTYKTRVRHTRQTNLGEVGFSGVLGLFEALVLRLLLAQPLNLFLDLPHIQKRQRAGASAM